MHLEEKITLLHGVPSASYTGATGAVPRLGIPALALNDGRQGFRSNDGSTGQTAGTLSQLARTPSWPITLPLRMSVGRRAYQGASPTPTTTSATTKKRIGGTCQP